MMPITEEVHAFLTANAAAQIQRDDEYLDPADGLLHCKTCHGLRQTVIPAPGGTGFLRPRCLCPCQSAAEKQRKAAEEKRERLERIQRRKAHGLQDRRLYDCTFANDNGKTPGLTAKAKRYVEHWEEAARKNIGLLLFGDGNRKILSCRVHCKRAAGAGRAGSDDKFPDDFESYDGTVRL